MSNVKDEIARIKQKAQEDAAATAKALADAAKAQQEADTAVQNATTAEQKAQASLDADAAQDARIAALEEAITTQATNFQDLLDALPQTTAQESEVVPPVA